MGTVRSPDAFPKGTCSCTTEGGRHPDMWGVWIPLRNAGLGHTTREATRLSAVMTEVCKGGLFQGHRDCPCRPV